MVLRGVVGLAVAAMMALALCGGAVAQSGPVVFATSRVVVETAVGGHYPFTIELAETPEQRERGLMYRSQLGDDAGMLFLFDEPRVATFWMRNTFIPLDIIFLAKGGLILHIHKNAVPGSGKVISSPAPVVAVLELKGGATSRLGIRRGDVVVHDRLN